MLFFQPITRFPVPVLSIAQARHPADYATLQALPAPPPDCCLGYGAYTALSLDHEPAGATVRWLGKMAATEGQAIGIQSLSEATLVHIQWHRRLTFDLEVFFHGGYPSVVLDAGKEQRHILASEGRQFSPGRIRSPSG